MKTKPGLTRRKDWEQRLDDFLSIREDQPILLGKRDCLMLAYDVVLAETGFDLDEAIDEVAMRGKYTTLPGAYALGNHYTKVHSKNTNRPAKYSILLEFFSMLADVVGLVEKTLDDKAHGDIVIFRAETLVGGVHDMMGVVVYCKPEGSNPGLNIMAQGEEGLEVGEIGAVTKIWGFVDADK